MTKSTDATFRRHMAELDTGTYSKGSIRGLLRAINNNYRIAQGWSANVSMTPAQEDTLMGRIWSNPPTCTVAHAREGLARLKALHFTKAGNVRSTSPFTLAEAIAIGATTHFTFVDIYEHGGKYLPVYALHTAAHGEAFKFVSGNWQCGLKLLVLRG